MDIILHTFLGPSGLSRAGQEFFRLLTKDKIRVIPRWLRLNPRDIQYVNAQLAEEMIKASSFFPMVGQDYCQFFVGTPNNIPIMTGRKLGIASIVQEAASLNAEQSQCLRMFDLVLAPSTFCRNAYLSSGINPQNVFLVPYPLNIEKWHPKVHPSQDNKEGIFRFLFMNTPFERKGIDLLIQAFLTEFKRGEPVELSIKTYQEHAAVNPRNVVAEIANRNHLKFSLSAPVKIYDEALNDERLPSFMKSFDALVSPHRSEGFGMNVWYAMALGIPVICTNYGGTMDFAKQDFTWLIDLGGYSNPSPREYQLFPNLKGIVWGEPDLESLKRQMRACFKDGQARKQKAEAGAIFVKENFCDDVIAKLFKDALEKKSPGIWDQLTSLDIKVPPKMAGGNATMLEV